ncbi:MAG: hypothetical protein IPO60_16245 [Flavobacteriales bacterium]|mgnify:CR=1 FL=1|jgi:hypothetical protein|nr:hypothetical protein [Flavobacteriales bacterium]MBK6893118.1 hypothetical protein [Flavobacteriales bacterium]MBK7249160.1 hypothetical protein [Flavobacteriales bacterium]MBK7285720.1 hypothetical protein [Flavobacteriales bacterium]MBK9058602.1 hypothetical protein [Flavobacteriales bacterium]
MEQELTPSESLKLIETMIGQAKSSFSRMSFYFLMWGVLLLAAMVTTYMMRDAGDAWAHGAAWGVAGALGGIISSIYGFRQGKKEQVANPMDRVVGWIWGAFVITMLLMMFAFAGTGRDPGAAITLLTAMPTFLTGQVMRFRPLIFGGLLFWLSGMVMFYSGNDTVIVSAYCIAMVFGYIVPGILLKRQEDGLRTA